MLGVVHPLFYVIAKKDFGALLPSLSHQLALVHRRSHGSTTLSFALWYS